jgi:hypothetical protein
MNNIEVLKVENGKIFVAPKGQMLKSFIKEDNSSRLTRDQAMISVVNTFSNMTGVVMEAGCYLTNVYNYVNKEYPEHKIIYRKDDGNFIELYYEKARHICGGMGTKDGVKFTCYIERKK